MPFTFDQSEYLVPLAPPNPVEHVEADLPEEHHRARTFHIGTGLPGKREPLLWFLLPKYYSTINIMLMTDT